MVTSLILIVELRYFGSHRLNIFEKYGVENFWNDPRTSFRPKTFGPALACITHMLCLFRLELYLFGYTQNYMYGLAYLPRLSYPFCCNFGSPSLISLTFHHSYPHSLHVNTSFLGFATRLSGSLALRPASSFCRALTRWPNAPLI